MNDTPAVTYAVLLSMMPKNFPLPLFIVHSAHRKVVGMWSTFKMTKPNDKALKALNVIYI